MILFDSFQNQNELTTQSILVKKNANQNPKTKYKTICMTTALIEPLKINFRKSVKFENLEMLKVIEND